MYRACQHEGMHTKPVTRGTGDIAMALIIALVGWSFPTWWTDWSGSRHDWFWGCSRDSVGRPPWPWLGRLVVFFFLGILACEVSLF